MTRTRTPAPHNLARATGGLLAGLAVTAATVVFTAPPPAATPELVHSQSQARPSIFVPAPLAAISRPARRASRGGLRTALPPLQYVTKTVAVGSTFSGQASWYGGSFQGRRTADGERFNTDDLTAASKTLAFGTRLRVCRHSRCVVVRINDRGPYVAGRILDLSRAARNALGYDGVAFVTATPVETKQVAVRRPVVRPRVLAVRSAPIASPSPSAQPIVAPPAVQAAVDQAPTAPVVGLAAGLVTVAGAGLVCARRRRTRSRF